MPAWLTEATSVVKASAFSEASVAISEADVKKAVQKAVAEAEAAAAARVAAAINEAEAAKAAMRALEASMSPPPTPAMTPSQPASLPGCQRSAKLDAALKAKIEGLAYQQLDSLDGPQPPKPAPPSSMRVTTSMGQQRAKMLDKSGPACKSVSAPSSAVHLTAADLAAFDPLVRPTDQAPPQQTFEPAAVVTTSASEAETAVLVGQAAADSHVSEGQSQRLAAMFPQLDYQVVAAVLESTAGRMDAAVDRLMQMGAAEQVLHEQAASRCHAQALPTRSPTTEARSGTRSGTRMHPNEALDTTEARSGTRSDTRTHPSEALYVPKEKGPSIKFRKKWYGAGPRLA